MNKNPVLKTKPNQKPSIPKKGQSASTKVRFMVWVLHTHTLTLTQKTLMANKLERVSV